MSTSDNTATMTNPSTTSETSQSSTNTDTTTNPSPLLSETETKQNPQTMAHHRQVLEQKIAENNNQNEHEYISPSDAIMSPASQKLAGFKQRQISKGGNSSTARSLFAKQMSGKENLGQERGGEKKSLEEGLGG